MKEYVNKKIIDYFKNRNQFTRNELYDFYRKYEPNLKEGTFGWRIYDLRQNNIIKSTGRSLYVISYKPQYNPHVSNQLIKLNTLIKKEYNQAKYAIWETSWLNEFTIHQATKNLIILDIEKFLTESAYYYLKDSNYKNIFLNPKDNIIDKYISEENEVIIVKPLIHRSPTQRIKTIKVPSIEKILLDIFYETKIFFFYQGEEIYNIFHEVIEKYSLNYSKLFNYAKRRGQEENIKEYITKNFKNEIKELLE